MRIGVIGVGSLGLQHVRIFKRIECVDDVACFDIDGKKSARASRDFGARSCSSLQDLLARVDAVSIVVPTTSHKQEALTALDAGKHVFIEKPLASTSAEAAAVVDMANSCGRLLQVGHVERFNPVIDEALNYASSPSFIEIERLSPFSFRGTDVPVVMDLMIHDLDLVLLMAGDRPAEIRAKGASVLTAGPDIVNARLEFPGGCVANITASRISMESSRKMRLFSPSRYLSVDLLEGKVKHYRRKEGFKKELLMLKQSRASFETFDISNFLDIKEFKVEGEEPLFRELTAFCRAVKTGSSPSVSGEDGLRVLKLAADILEKLSIESVS